MTAWLDITNLGFPGSAFGPFFFPFFFFSWLGSSFSNELPSVFEQDTAPGSARRRLKRRERDKEKGGRKTETAGDERTMGDGG
jgi:hypothetical protein